MNIKIGPIQIFVSDVKKAEGWYSEILGMKLIKEYPKFKCILMRLGKAEFDIGTPIPEWGEGWDKVLYRTRTYVMVQNRLVQVFFL